METGQRIEIFRVDNDLYCNVHKVGGYYAEVLNSAYYGNPYGRDIIGEEVNPYRKGWHLNIPLHMKPVGAMIIKSIKNNDSSAVNKTIKGL